MARLTGSTYAKSSVSKKKQIELYRRLLLPRMIEEKMLILLRQGKISKWFSGIGQEAISVGCTAALEKDELLFPMHRNLGVFTGRDIPLSRLFGQWQGKDIGFTNGRDRSFHFGTMDYNIVGMISHLGPQLSLASGVALAHKLKKEKKVSLAFTGEAATSEGEFHEAMNVASVWQLPVIFVIENNLYGLSTPVSEQYRCKDLVDRAAGYGMKSVIIDGNNILEVYEKISKIAKSLRKKPEPIMVECKTFRMRGHEEASGTKYVPKKLMDEWAKKDPLTNFENHLIASKILSKEEVDAIRAEYKEYIQSELEIANSQPLISADIEKEVRDVFAPHTSKSKKPKSKKKSQKRMIDAIQDGLDHAMKKHKDLVLMGQDIGDYGGVFKITDGFVKKYGRERVRNTPLCESAIVGISLGLSLTGIKSMMEMQFADFATCGFNQIVNNLAKIHYRWGQNADIVVRMPTGAGVKAGPFHSQSNEAWFTHTPGLKVVYPSNPYNAKGLLLAAFEDPNPVLFFEHKALYRKLAEDIPDDYYTVEIGKAHVEKIGTDLTIITYGQGVLWAMAAAENNAADIEVIDLLSLAPIDWETITASIKKTNKVIVLHEDTHTGGIGGDIAAYVSEHLFEYLDGPILRVSSLDTPVPFAGALEEQFLASYRLDDAITSLLNY